MQESHQRNARYYGNDDGAGGYKRLKTFVDMINVGLILTNYSTTNSPLPFLFMIGDNHACDVPHEKETFRIDYPRLSWAMPAPRYNQDEGVMQLVFQHIRCG